MTTGSTSNHHPLPPRDDRETLSALFDGELPGDAMRFALKRLDHDANWRDTCGRWQMIGDALRGEATAAAPLGFAAGVGRILEAEWKQAAAAVPIATPVVASRSRRRWIGGAALAASVAVAAVLVVRPFSETSPSTGQVASGVVAPTNVPAPVVRSTEVGAPAAAAPRSATPDNAIASADSTSTTRTRRPDAPVSRSARPSHASNAPEQIATNESASVIAAATAPVTTGRPFHPPVDDIVTRPWPRAVLSGDAATGGLTVGFGSGSTPPSSLYPFEPRLPDNPPNRPQATEPQR